MPWTRRDPRATTQVMVSVWQCSTLVPILADVLCLELWAPTDAAPGGKAWALKPSGHNDQQGTGTGGSDKWWLRVQINMWFLMPTPVCTSFVCKMGMTASTSPGFVKIKWHNSCARHSAWHIARTWKRMGRLRKHVRSSDSALTTVAKRLQCRFYWKI